MLRWLELQNFIHFKDKHKLEFDDGAHFLIGENNSGKTSLFEGIRRCMSISKSNDISGVHDTEKLACVTCLFERGDDEVISSIIRIPTLFRKGNVDHVYIKLAQISNGMKKCAYGDVVKKNTDENLVCHQLEHSLVIIDAYKDKNFPSNVEDLLKQHTDNLFPFYQADNKGKYTHTDCEKLLQETVDQYTLVILPFRSISPFQSTETPPKPKTKRSKIAKKASWKADILRWYLLNKNHLGEQECAKEEYYFNLITAYSGFEFRIDDAGIISVQNRILRKRHLDSARHLLKIPEGIYEAKVFAVLSAVQKFKTVCLDDAERGMHPQMIERVRDFVLQQIQNKVVLLITHNHDYIARWNVQRIFLFQIRGDEENEWFEIKSLKTLFYKGGTQNANTREATNSQETEEKTLQLIADRTCSRLFFAKRILLVEGKSDELFMTEFMKILLGNQDLIRRFLGNDNATEVDEVLFFLSGFCIIPMYGAPNAFKFNSICQKLEIQHYLMLDYDALSNNIPKGTKGKTTEERLCNALNITLASERIQCLKDNVPVLEEKRIFMWNQKTRKIENAVMALFDRNPTHGKLLQDFLIDKNKKLLLDKNVRYDYMQRLVKECLELSVEDELSEIRRLVNFFMKSCSK